MPAERYDDDGMSDADYEESVMTPEQREERNDRRLIAAADWATEQSQRESENPPEDDLE